MDQTQIFLTETLRAYLTGDIVQGTADFDWQGYCRLCMMQGVGGIAYSVLARSGAAIPAAEAQILKESCCASVYYAEAQKYEYDLFTKSLDEAGIRHMPFKGLILRRLYPDPDLRTMGDMDILVHRDDQLKCHQILSEMGYRYIADKNERLYEKGLNRFEIHDRIKHAFDSRDRRWDFDYIWNRSKTQRGLTYREPDPQLHLILLLDHMAMHAIDNGFGIRMLLDVAILCMSHCDLLDKESLDRELKHLGIHKFSELIFLLCQRLFGTKNPLDDHERRGDEIQELGDFILGGGVFGDNLNSLTYIDNKLAKEYITKKTGIKSRLSAGWSHAFPSGYSMSKRYPYLIKKPYLLFAAWIQRMFSMILKRPADVIKFLVRIIRNRESKVRFLMLRRFGL